MSIFRRRKGVEKPSPLETRERVRASDGGRDPLARYADTLTVVARYTAETMTADPDYDTATVARFAVGGDAPVEELRDDILTWLRDEVGFTGHNELAFKRRHINVGASGVEAEVILALMGGAAGGVGSVLAEKAVGFVGGRLKGRVDHLQPIGVGQVEEMRFAVARAFDVRPSDLELIEGSIEQGEYAAVFRDRAGRRYGVTVRSSRLVIRRL